MNNSALINPAARFPRIPILMEDAHVVVCEFDLVLGEDFCAVLENLAETYRDDSVSVAVFDPSAEYYADAYGHSSTFVIAGAELGRQYIEKMWFAPGGDPTGRLSHSANVLSLVGSSHSWAVWVQRDWEVGVIVTKLPIPDDVCAEATLVDPMDDFTFLRAPAGWNMELTIDDLTEFRRGVARVQQPRQEYL